MLRRGIILPVEKKNISTLYLVLLVIEMSDALLSWCVDQLHHKFGLEACDDIVR